jgi:hypothetical protein
LMEFNLILWYTRKGIIRCVHNGSR